MSKRNMRHSREQEKRIAKILGGRRHAMSGSRPEQDGDGHVGSDPKTLDYILLECKRTNGTEQITIKRKDLEKHNREARQNGREPVLAFELDGDYAIVDVHYLAELLDHVRNSHRHEWGEWGSPVAGVRYRSCKGEVCSVMEAQAVVQA